LSYASRSAQAHRARLSLASRIVYFKRPTLSCQQLPSTTSAPLGRHPGSTRRPKSPSLRANSHSPHGRNCSILCPPPHKESREIPAQGALAHHPG